MPQFNDIIASREKKKFVKKNYRAWDLTGTGSPSLEKTSLLNLNPAATQTNIQSTSTDSNIQDFPKLSTVQNKSLDKGSLEFKNVEKGSGLEFIKEFKSSNKNSNKSLLGFTRVQLNPNYPHELGFNGSKYSLPKMLEKSGGNDRKLFFFVVNLCSLNGGLSTGELFGTELDQFLGIPRNSRETCLKRMNKKGLLQRGIGKRGVHGTLSLSLSEEVKVAALSYLSTHSPEGDNLLNSWTARVQNRVQLGFNPNHNSSNNINTTTTDYAVLSEKGSKNKQKLPEEWGTINFEPLAEIGFSEEHLLQLYTKSLNTPEVVQESIHHFAFALQHNAKVQTYSEPLNVFMGVLRKGRVWIEPNYRSAKEIAISQLLEAKRAEKERLQALEQNAFQLALDEWSQKLSPEESAHIESQNQNPASQFMPKRIKLEQYFKEHIWPTVQTDYLHP